MSESQAATLERLRAVEEVLRKPRQRGDDPASLRGLEQTAAAMLHVLSLLGEMSKDLHEQVSALRTEAEADCRVIDAVPLIEELVTELRLGQAAAFKLHLAVQSDPEESKFVDPEDVPDDNGIWVQAKSIRQ